MENQAGTRLKFNNEPVVTDFYCLVAKRSAVSSISNTVENIVEEVEDEAWKTRRFEKKAQRKATISYFLK
jgi:hypothetical protein